MMSGYKDFSRSGVLTVYAPGYWLPAVVDGRVTTVWVRGRRLLSVLYMNSAHRRRMMERLARFAGLGFEVGITPRVRVGEDVDEVF